MNRRPRTPDQSLYTLQSTDQGYIITKYDSIGLEMLSQYELLSMPDGDVSCPCPQGHAPSCRHRKMLPMMKARVDTNWFFCYGTGEWKAMSNAEGASNLEEVNDPNDDNGAAKPYEEVITEANTPAMEVVEPSLKSQDTTPTPKAEMVFIDEHVDFGDKPQSPLPSSKLRRI